MQRREHRDRRLAARGLRRRDHHDRRCAERLGLGERRHGVDDLFPEDLTAAIFTSHPEYKPYGQPDTTFANDSVMAGIPSADRARNILDYARMTDGAMLASKTVTVT